MFLHLLYWTQYLHSVVQIQKLPPLLFRLLQHLPRLFRSAYFQVPFALIQLLRCHLLFPSLYLSLFFYWML
ncbi:ORF91 [White spot syndrome virus]|uniref:ORF91 n=1 Tax=White spot syndrome virus TaxID=342409 RepID=A0A2D3I6F0_9VIRU|nr:ORF91 [White spot syndrome virus]